LDGEDWIEIRGSKTNKTKATKFELVSLKHVTPNKYKALSTHIEDTTSPPEQFPNNNKTLAAQNRKKKRPTQKHVRPTLWLLAQQENAFLEHSITRAENKTTELAKRDKTNKQRISIDKHYQSPHHQLEWSQKVKHASHSITGSLYRAFKLANHPSQRPKQSALRRRDRNAFSKTMKLRP
jgi:hypothetical protein